MNRGDAANRGFDLPHGVQGAADPSFACAVRGLAGLFPHPRFGGGALSVYLDGEPVVDVWVGWSDRRGRRRWSADTAPMVFSATKGVASTVIHRLADRGLIDYDAPVAEYWHEFGANGKAQITVRDVMRHRAGLSHLRGVRKREVLDHRHMEERIAAAPVGRHFGKSAYHALTYGWLLSGLARSVTGKGMRELMRLEVAAPLNTDGVHLGRPPVGAPTRVAKIIGPQLNIPNPVFNAVAPAIAGLELSAAFGTMYIPGVKALVQRDIPLLDTELPSANGVITARALARMFGAIANGGVIDGRRYLSAERVAMLTGPQPAAGPQPHRPVGLPSRLPRSAHPRSAARVRACGPRGIVRMGHPGRGPGFQLRPQPPAHTAGGHGSGRFRRYRRSDPARRRAGTQARLHLSRRVRLALPLGGGWDRRCSRLTAVES